MIDTGRWLLFRSVDSVLSQRISVMHFPLIVAVLFIHNYSSIVSFSGGEVGLLQMSYLPAVHT